MLVIEDSSMEPHWMYHVVGKNQSKVGTVSRKIFVVIRYPDRITLDVSCC
jgi:hypothetical protein